MLKTVKTLLFLSILLSVSCSNKKFENSIGTWELTKIKDERTLVSKVQICKIGTQYIAGLEYSRPVLRNKYFFYPCDIEWNKLIIRPSQYLAESNFSDDLLIKKSEIIYSPELDCIFFLNSIFLRTSQNIFEINNNRISIIDSI